jgi:eukaryotic-like serine/threonine-protein kinase
MVHFAPGAVVCGGRFRVVRVLAIGGMGSVYDVEDTSVGRTFVLKTLHGELAAEGEMRRQMHREARVLGRIDHPNIVRIFTAGVTENDLPYIVMEKLEGASLREVLRGGARVPRRAAVHATIELLLALEHVHEIGIIHCDVKPENIYLHADRRRIVPKLLDFGVVRVLSRGDAAVRRGGTMRYASPEQVRGDAVGPRSDVYAMALVLYEMLAGRSPFHDVMGQTRIAEAQLHRKPVPIAGVPPRLMGIVLRALEKEAQARPHDAFAFARELIDVEGLLGDERSLERAVALTRMNAEETTRRQEAKKPDEHDTIVDLSSSVSSADLETSFWRHASVVTGGGGR